MSERRQPSEASGSGHPMKASILLLVGVTLLIFVLALLSTMH